MCLILFIPKNTEFPQEKLERAHLNNSDGFGVMWHDGQQSRTLKFDDCDMAVINDTLKMLRPFNVGVHFRWRTHGEIDFTNTHPYPVFTREEDGYDLHLMHNGVLDIETKDDPTKSDTWHYVNGILRPLLKGSPEMLGDNKTLRQLIADHIGSGNKFMFMLDDGRFVTLNHFLDMNGCLASNTYAFAPPFKGYSSRAWGWDDDDFAEPGICGAGAYQPSLPYSSNNTGTSNGVPVTYLGASTSPATRDHDDVKDTKVVDVEDEDETGEAALIAEVEEHLNEFGGFLDDFWLGLSNHDVQVIVEYFPAEAADWIASRCR